MAIPKAVQDQANRSEELLQQMRDKEEGKTGDKPDGEKPADAQADHRDSILVVVIAPEIFPERFRHAVE